LPFTPPSLSATAHNRQIDILDKAVDEIETGIALVASGSMAQKSNFLA
jgi:hypothetical protein